MGFASRLSMSKEFVEAMGLPARRQCCKKGLFWDWIRRVVSTLGLGYIELADLSIANRGLSGEKMDWMACLLQKRSQAGRRENPCGGVDQRVTLNGIRLPQILIDP